MHARILIADADRPKSAELRAVLSDQYSVSQVENVADCLIHVEQFKPDLVLLDVQLPGASWEETCRLIKSPDCSPFSHVVLMSRQWTTEQRLRGYEAGADDHLIWPTDEAELLAKLRVLMRLRDALQQSCDLNSQIQTYNRELERLVDAKAAALEATQDITVFALAKLADSRDTDTGEHLDRIRYYTQILARQLCLNSAYSEEVDDSFLEELYRASPLHDIGKVGIPDSILLKPGRFTDNEFERMKLHTIVGAETLEQAASQFGSGHFLKMASEIARFHHERFDGTGYPRGLRGQQIPLAARIVALADVYDALTSDRVYKTASAPEQARDEIVAQRGAHFDPVVVDAFLDCFEDFRRVRRSLDGRRPWSQDCSVSGHLPKEVIAGTTKFIPPDYGRSVLLALADPKLRNAFLEVLPAAGYVVRAVENGLDAVRLIDEDCPHFLVIDWELKQLSGLDVCRHLRHHHRHHYSYVMMLMETSDHEAMVEAVDAGADRVDVKPVTTGELLAGIRGGANVIGLVRELSQQPRKDPLTGLATRRLIDDHLTREWRRACRYRVPLSCVIVDIDSFGTINERYGDRVGDGALETIAGILNDNCRSCDYLFRHGGDQFCIVMPDTNELGALDWAERVQGYFAATTLKGRTEPLQITASFGVAQRRSTHARFEDLLNAAEQSLAVAKKSGRNRAIRFGSLGKSGNGNGGARGAMRSPFEAVRAREIMTSPIATVRCDQTALEAAQIVLQYGINSIPVVDDDGRLAGIVSEKDLMTMMISGESWRQPIRNCMTTNVVTYDENEAVDVIYKFLMRSPIRRIVVMNGHRPTGVISRGTLLSYFAAHSHEWERFGDGTWPTKRAAEPRAATSETVAGHSYVGQVSNLPL